MSALGPLELREDGTRRPRLTAPVLTCLAVAAARFGRHALAYRWNTGYAFDVHSRWAGTQLARLQRPPEVVLQNGALFAPGAPPLHPYVVYLDHTRALTERAPALPWAGYEEAPSWGAAWRAREGATYRGAAAIATFSRNTADSVVHDYGADPNRVHVVGAGANVFPADWSRHDDGRTIVFVGREFERKGGVVLAEAFAQLRRERPRARLLVAGPVQPLALPEGAVQLGPVAYEALPALFAQATVFALPALHEPFGIAFLDAMACGVPCIGTRTSAVPEIIDDGGTGLLVPRGDVRALHAALLRMIDDPARARRMGERGRHKVQERFTWTCVAEHLTRVLASATGRPPRTESLLRAVHA